MCGSVQFAAVPSMRARLTVSFAALLIAGATAFAQGPTWASPATVPAARSGHAMAFDQARGRAVLFGGHNGAYLGDTWEWDGQGWIRCTPLHSPSARSYHGLAFDPVRGKTVLFGGIGSAAQLGDTWEWDGVDWLQRTPATSPAPRDAHAMAWHGGASPGVLLFGGFANGLSAETWRFDGTNWQLVGTGGPTPRAEAMMTFAPPHGCTFLVGGANGSSSALGDVWSWNGSAWSSVLSLGLVPNASRASLNWDEARWQLVLTGADAFAPVGGVTLFASITSSTFVTWTQVPNVDPVSGLPSPTPRVASAGCYDSARLRQVYFGGFDPTVGAVGANVNTLHELAVTGVWIERRVPAPLPGARIYTEMAFDQGTGRAVLYGGWSGTSALGDTWSWNGTKWTDHGTTGTAGPRIQPALCWTPWLGVVMFGGASGFGSGFYNDTMAWTGTDWLPTLTAGAPVGRYGHDMVLDAARNRIVMFGGYGAGGAMNTTHELVSTSPFTQQWFQIATTGTPPARNSHRLAYDRRRQRTVMFGGSDVAGIFLGDTWEYDGATATWTQVFPPVSPPRRWNHVMEYDAGRGVVVMTGGYGNPQCGNFCASHLNDVWEYDGVTWRQRTTGTTLPSGREGAGSAYDTVHQRMVMQGGGASTYPTETWLYNAPVDRQGQGMAVNPFALRCTKYPVAGQTTGFTFPSPDGIGGLLVMLQPGPSPLVVLGPTLMCGTATLYAGPDILFTTIGNPAVVPVTLPGSMAGIGFAVQGLVLDVPGDCFRLSDPLAVTPQAP